MAGQKTPRPAKRHLVRWTDDMDKKLLLTIQSVCNADGVKIPWDKVGAIMGDQITDGAVIQHLAKLRQRMVAQGLSVPPPLKRGGGSLISTGYSGSSYRTSKPATARNTKATTNRASLDATQGDKEQDEEDVDVDKASDPDGEFTETPSKRVKREPKKSRVKKDNSDDNDEHIPKAEKANGKRKHSQPEATETKANANLEVDDAESVAASRTLHGLSIVSAVGRERRSSVDYADIDDNDDFDDEYHSDGQYVAGGAPFLELHGSVGNGLEAEYQEGQDPEHFESGNIGEQGENPSKLVVLRIGKGESAVRNLQNESNSAVEHTTNYIAPAMPRAIGNTTDYITPSMPRGIGLSGHAIDRVAEQQLHWTAPHQDRGRNQKSSTSSRRSSTGFQARSPQVSGNNAVDFSRYGSVGHMNGYYPASDFSGHSMINQPLQQNPGHGLPGSTSVQNAQMEAPGMMPSPYTQQASAPHNYPNLSSVAAANWGPSASLARNMAYNGFETGYGANDMFSQGMLDDPILGPEDGLEEFDFRYADAE